MKPSLLISITLGCAVLGWLMGCGAALIWMHPLVAFGAFLLLALASLRLHPRRGRVAGVPVNPGRATAS